MNFERHTVSLCNTCYKEIPAIITVTAKGVVMKKQCSQHGPQEALVERDPLFYTYVMALASPNIYAGYFVDVTRRCNLRCKFCFYPLQKADPEGEFSIESIVAECAVNAHRAPFILTGGEPTLRPDIGDLIKAVSAVGPVELLTNGTKLAEDAVYNEIMPLITNNDGVASLNLSIHPETDKWRTVLESARRDKITVESVLIVVDSKESFLAALETAKEYADVVQGFRIKAATAIWNEQKPNQDTKIFCSDMLNWLEEAGIEYSLITRNRHNKSVFVNVAVGKLFLMLVSWNDTSNVDLADINCGPYYRARNGEVLNMVSAMLVNEGVSRGWLKGRRIDDTLKLHAQGEA